MEPQPELAIPTDLAGVVRAAAARQPQFPAALAGADCQRDRRLVLHAFDLHAAAAVDRARQFGGAGAGSASAAADLRGSDGGRGERPAAPQARDDRRRPGALRGRAGHAAGAFAIDGVAGLSAAAGGNDDGRVLRAGPQCGDSEHCGSEEKCWSPTRCRRRRGR